MGGFDWTGTLAPWGEEGRLQYDEMGRPVVEIMTDGECGRSWNDKLITSRTPVPAARCPFEYDHDGTDEGDELYRAGLALERAEDAVTDATEAGAPSAVIKQLAAGRDYVWGEYLQASRAVAHQREHKAISRAAHVDLATPRAAEVRAYLAREYGDMVTDDMVRSVVAGLEEEG